MREEAVMCERLEELMNDGHLNQRVVKCKLEQNTLLLKY